MKEIFFAKLYLISTPIGNLNEISFRVLETIKNMDYIASEDTRVSGNLLFLYKIKKKFISCHKYNEAKISSKIIKLIKEGKKIAYMCDAGTPCISDPGQILVKKCIENGIDIVPIGCSSALINIAIVSGFDIKHFYFHGFLEKTREKRKNELKELSLKYETIIFFEAPHRLKKTLEDMVEIFGDRRICIGREITKIHEEFIRGTVKNVLEQLDKKQLKGEFSIAVEGKDKNFANVINKQEIINKINFFKKKEKLNLKEAIKKTSLFYKIHKNKVYRIYLLKE